MSRLENMIRELCPDGVESVPIGSLITRIRERGKDAPEVSQVYAVSNTLGMVRAEDYRDNTIHSEDTSNYTVVRKGMVAYNPSRLNIGSIAMLKADEPGLVSPMYVVFAIDEKRVNREYFDYLMHSSYVANKVDSFKEEGARFRFDFSRWNWIMVQIPPVQIQCEIVRILDMFMDLRNSIDAEFAARKMQYEYYRKNLISFDTQEDVYEIGSVCQLSAGGDVPKNSFSEIQTKEYPIPIISNGVGDKGFYGYTDTWRINKPCVTVAARGAGVGHVTYRDYPFFPIIRLVSVIPGEMIDSKYLYYALQNIKFEPTQGSIPQLTVPMIAKCKIPVPPIKVQQRIVRILDTFESICSDKTGLPIEIEYRKRQYEFYRDKLLSFMEK